MYGIYTKYFYSRQTCIFILCNAQTKVRKWLEILEISSNICPLRDAPLTRPFSESAFIAHMSVLLLVHTFCIQIRQSFELATFNLWSIQKKIRFHHSQRNFKQFFTSMYSKGTIRRVMMSPEKFHEVGFKNIFPGWTRFVHTWMTIAVVATLYMTSGYVINWSVQNFVPGIYGSAQNFLHCISWKLKELNQIKPK